MGKPLLRKNYFCQEFLQSIALSQSVFSRLKSPVSMTSLFVDLSKILMICSNLSLGHLKGLSLGALYTAQMTKTLLGVVNWTVATSGFMQPSSLSSYSVSSLLLPLSKRRGASICHSYKFSRLCGHGNSAGIVRSLQFVHRARSLSKL